MRIAIAAVAVAVGVGLLASAAAEPLDWTVEAGAAARVRPAHIGSDQYLVDAAPIFEARLGDDVTISLDDGAKWRALKIGALSAGPIAEYRQSFNDQSPRGSFRMSDAVELGAFTEWRTPIGIAEARLRRAVNGYQGWSGDLSFSTGAPVTPKLSLGGQARLSWADAAFTEEYFGLKPHAATRSGLPRFLDEDFLTVGGEFDAARQLTHRTRLVLAVSADRMISEMQRSPLFTTRNIFTASLGLTYRWSANPMGRAP
jgi:outer membrane scaffolding protein for murein synthesis (MipA/OmpV family)